MENTTIESTPVKDEDTTSVREEAGLKMEAAEGVVSVVRTTQRAAWLMQHC